MKLQPQIYLSKFIWIEKLMKKFLSVLLVLLPSIALVNSDASAAGELKRFKTQLTGSNKCMDYFPRDLGAIVHGCTHRRKHESKKETIAVLSKRPYALRC